MTTATKLTWPRRLVTGTIAVGLAALPALAQQGTTTLDPRIDASKITEQDLPPLPEDILLPLPADHRIAAAADEVPLTAAQWDAANEALRRGLEALVALQDPISGGWMVGVEAAPTDHPDEVSPVATAVTALALKALVQANDPAYAEAIERASVFIARSRNEDGSFAEGSIANYVTSAVASAMAALGSTSNRTQLGTTVRWLQDAQWDGSEGLSDRQDWYGGAGYGSHGRPDLSNTQMMLDALYDSGLSPSEPAFQRALAFVSRAQNFTATNSAPWASNDGGFIYTPANGGESMASQYAGEGRYGETMPQGQARSLRSYGSMTYAGFKSLLYAGLSPDDPRVRAAFDWIRHHWTFDENPGVGQQGLYYYYHSMARALRVAQQQTITDAEGVAHDWRAEMVAALVRRQRDNGTWQNDEDRWLEAEPVLATTYSALALEEILKPVSRTIFEQQPAPEPKR